MSLKLNFYGNDQISQPLRLHITMRTREQLCWILRNLIRRDVAYSTEMECSHSNKKRFHNQTINLQSSFSNHNRTNRNRWLVPKSLNRDIFYKFHEWMIVNIWLNLSTLDKMLETIVRSKLISAAGSSRVFWFLHIIEHYWNKFSSLTKNHHILSLQKL